MPSTLVLVFGLALDGDEESFAAGEELVFGVAYRGGAEVFAAFYAVLSAAQGQGGAERGGAKVFGFHLAGEGHDFGAVGAGVDGFAHGFVEDGGDDASVDEAVGALEAFGQAQGSEYDACLIDGEAQAHADAVVGAAAEAVVLVVEGEGDQVVVRGVHPKFRIAESAGAFRGVPCSIGPTSPNRAVGHLVFPMVRA